MQQVGVYECMGVVGGELAGGAGGGSKGGTGGWVWWVGRLVAG